VLRTLYFPFGDAAYTAFFANKKLQLGDRDDLRPHLELWSTHALFERLPRVVNSILLLVLALFLLVLYFTQKGHYEYLWLALHELALAPLGFVELAGSSARSTPSGTRPPCCSWCSSPPISTLNFSTPSSP
jgi:hypothetical protein